MVILKSKLLTAYPQIKIQEWSFFPIEMKYLVVLFLDVESDINRSTIFAENLHFKSEYGSWFSVK